MNIHEAEQMAKSMMAEHGLTAAGWVFKFSQARSRLGSCHYKTKTIRLSLPEAQAAPVEDIRQTMLHEIAHALVGAGHAHDRAWLARARSIGYTGGVSAHSHANHAAREEVMEQRGATMLDWGTTRLGMRIRVHVPGNALDGATGVVTKKNSKTAGIRLDNGSNFRVGYALLSADSEPSSTAEAKPAAPSTAPTPIRVGDHVTIHRPGKKYHGLHGVVVRMFNGKAAVDTELGMELSAPMMMFRHAERDAVLPPKPDRSWMRPGARCLFEGKPGRIVRVNQKSVTVMLDNGQEWRGSFNLFEREPALAAAA